MRVRLPDQLFGVAGDVGGWVKDAAAVIRARTTLFGYNLPEDTPLHKRANFIVESRKEIRVLVEKGESVIWSHDAQDQLFQRASNDSELAEKGIYHMNLHSDDGRKHKMLYTNDPILAEVDPRLRK